MLLSKIRLEEGMYKVNIFNDITNEDMSRNFKELKEATDYVLHFEEEYYDFKFNPVIFDVNYERFKLIIENSLNPSDDLINTIKEYNHCFERMLIESNYYFYITSKDSPESFKDIYGISKEELDNLTLEDIEDILINDLSFLD